MPKSASVFSMALDICWISLEVARRVSTRSSRSVAGNRRSRSARTRAPEGGRAGADRGREPAAFFGGSIASARSVNGDCAPSAAKGSGSGSHSSDSRCEAPVPKSARRPRRATITAPVVSASRTIRPPHRPSTPPTSEPTPHPISPPPRPDSLSARLSPAARASTPIRAKKPTSSATTRTHGISHGIPSRRRPNATAPRIIVRGTIGTNQPSHRTRAAIQASTRRPWVRPSIPSKVISAAMARPRAAASSPCSRSQPARSHAVREVPPASCPRRADRRVPRALVTDFSHSARRPGAGRRPAEVGDGRWDPSCGCGRRPHGRFDAVLRRPKAQAEFALRRLEADDPQPQAVSFVDQGGRVARRIAAQL